MSLKSQVQEMNEPRAIVLRVKPLPNGRGSSRKAYLRLPWPRMLGHHMVSVGDMGTRTGLSTISLKLRAFL